MHGKALLSNNTVMLRIESVSEDIKEHLLTGIKCSSEFGLQDESIDVAGLYKLQMFVRYCFRENIQEELDIFGQAILSLVQTEQLL